MTKSVDFFGQKIEVRGVDVEIKNDDTGEVIFEREGFEVPKDWDDLSAKIVANKYAMDYEDSVLDIFTRIINQLTEWGKKQGYFTGNTGYSEDQPLPETFARNLADILVNQRALFNSPVLFNLGVPENSSTASACFILPVEDNMQSILEQTIVEGMIFKAGSGAGRNVSTLRGKGELLSNKGSASGPCSFNKGWDAFAGAIKSGGRSRRSARLICLDVDHPDIMEFIECKTKEERKARILIKAGIPKKEAMATVAYQNGNHSIRVDDEFMRCVEADFDWRTINRGDGKVNKAYKARDIFRKIAECAHDTGDPGIQFKDRINIDNPVPHMGEIRSSNPCSEYFAIDNSSCNLASLNLVKYYNNDTDDFNFADMEKDIKILITAMDIIVDNADYPTAEIADITSRTRPLGLGFANLGALLMLKCLPYKSQKARDFASDIMRSITYYAYLQSIELAKKLGSYQELDKDVAKEIAQRIVSGMGGKKLSGLIDKYGLRNSQLTLLAPTGTTALVMGCGDSTGIEPLFALESVKTMSDGSVVKIIPKCVEEAVKNLNKKYNYTHSDESFKSEDFINEIIEDIQTSEDSEQGIFDTANDIPWKAHIDMVAAVQPCLSSGISKTINMPNDCTIEDFEEAYMYAWKQGLKCVSAYRDGSKAMQPLTAKSKDKKEISKPSGPPKAVRHELPMTRPAKIHKFDIGGMEGYLIPGIYEDGSLGELFIKVSNQGSTIDGLLDAFVTSLSFNLQHGVPLRKLVDKLKNSRFDPAGWTTNSQVPVCTSVIDYIAKWLEKEFLEDSFKVIESSEFEHPSSELEEPLVYDGNICTICGGLTQQSGVCRVCTSCGTTTGCS